MNLFYTFEKDCLSNTNENENDGNWEWKSVSEAEGLNQFLDKYYPKDN